MAWCSRFMARRGFVLRRVTHSGRERRVDREENKAAFVAEVVALLNAHFLALNTFYLCDVCSLIKLRSVATWDRRLRLKSSASKLSYRSQGLTRLSMHDNPACVRRRTSSFTAFRVPRCKRRRRRKCIARTERSIYCNLLGSKERMA